MTVVYHSRRHFLRGAGGFLLAMPLLPSLLPRTARADAATPQRRFIAFATEHGGIDNANMWPADSMLTEEAPLYADHKVRNGKLTLQSDGTRSILSPVLAASSGRLTSSLAAKLNLIRGLDIPFYISHHSGGHLGNFSRSDTAPPALQGQDRATIDQVMAYSPSFYASLSTVKERSLHVGLDGRWALSFTYQNPQARTGAVQMPTTASALDMFNRVFVPPKEDNTPTRKPVVDHVLESYKRLSKGAFGDANRLSKADRQRIDQHMDRVSELQRTLNVVASCGDTPPPAADATNDTHTQADARPELQTEYYQTFNDVIVAGMLCGTSRIAVVHAYDNFDASPIAQWHNDYAHMHTDPAKQAVMAEASRLFFEEVFLDLASKLDIEEGDTGNTYLDNSLIAWSQESGMETHESLSLPVVTAGGAGGFFRTGNYVDLRNRDNLSVTFKDTKGQQERRPGVLYSQWLGNALQSMGVPASEYEVGGDKGYGFRYRDDYYMGPQAPTAWPDRLFNDASQKLPFITT